MVKSARKGFTLVELLVTIVLLGVIGSIIIYNLTNVATNSKELEYERYIAKITSAAETYSSVNPDAFKELYVSKSFLYIRMEDLINNGYVDERLVNPYTDEVIKPSELIKANLDTTNGALTFEYPVQTIKEESFLVSLTDYVVNGEPYNCLQGAGSYQLALSDEEGNLIDLSDPETRNLYNFTCEFPSEFQTYGSDKPASLRVGKYTDKPGSYEITYNWITLSGTKKQAKRILRVMPVVTPTLAIYEEVSKDPFNPSSAKTSAPYNYNSKDYYSPSYSAATGWKYLTYKPFVEGSDPENTRITIKKISIDQYNENDDVLNGAVEETVLSNSLDFETTYKVDDGVKRYSIYTTIYGRYNKDYSYNASNSVIIRSKLLVDKSYINTDSTDWATNRTLTINKDLYSPVGIAYYEYRLSSSALSNSLPIENLYTFTNSRQENAALSITLNTKNRINVDTVKNISILNNSACKDTKTEYTNVYVRAINDNGYVGDWVSVPVNLTSDMQKLLIQDNDCIKTSSTSCYYTKKKAYLDYNGIRFVILENYGNGELLVTKDGVGPLATPTTMSNGHIQIASCDIMVYANFNYRSPIINNIINAVDMGIPNINKHAVLQQWPSSSIYIDTSYGDSGFGTTVQYTTRNSTYYYSSYYGNVTVNDTLKYQDALKENTNYWTIDMYSTQQNITAVSNDGTHSTETSYYNVYFHYVDRNGNYQRAYVGDTLPVKPMIRLKNINICGTTIDASGNIIYKVALNEVVHD